MEIRQVKLHQYKYICTACGNENSSSSGTNVPVLGLKQSGDTELSGIQTEGIPLDSRESIYSSLKLLSVVRSKNQKLDI